MRGVIMSLAEFEGHQRRHGFKMWPATKALVDQLPKPKNPRRAKQPNKTEREMYERLKRQAGVVSATFEGVTLRLADNCRYTPDFFCQRGPSPLLRPLFVEVKGAHAWDDSLVKFKVAKEMHGSWADFQLWRKQKGEWSRIL